MARVAAEVRREQLIDAAIRVAAREGVAATTTRRIAAEAGASLASVHYCFAGKQELLQAVLIAIINELADEPAEALPEGTGASELMRAELRALWAVVEREPEKQQVTYELTHYALRTPELTGLARWQYEVYYRRGDQRLARIADHAGIEWALPVSTLSRLVLNTIDGLVLGWLVDRDSARARAALDALADAVGGFVRAPVVDQPS